MQPEIVHTFPSTRTVGAADPRGIGSNAADASPGKPVVDFGRKPARMTRLADHSGRRSQSQCVKQGVRLLVIEALARWKLNENNGQFFAESGALVEKAVEFSASNPVVCVTALGALMAKRKASGVARAHRS